MTPQPCIAPRGEEGDCWRACIATILDLPVASVPNFAHETKDWAKMLAAARAWLKPRGLAIYQTYCSGAWPLDTVLHWFSGPNPETPFILCGASQRVPSSDHAVVAMNGRVAHDPSGSGLSGPCQGAVDNRWWFMHIICLSADQTPAPGQN